MPSLNPPPPPGTVLCRLFSRVTRDEGQCSYPATAGLRSSNSASAPAQLTTERCTRHVLAVHPAHSGPPQTTRNMKSAERLVGTGSAIGFEKGSGLVA